MHVCCTTAGKPQQLTDALALLCSLCACCYSCHSCVTGPHPPCTHTQGSNDASLTLLLPQCSSSALGHAAVCCAAADAARGLTCGDVLTTIHSFYQQDVVLVQQGDGCAAEAAAQGSEGIEGGEEEEGEGAGRGVRGGNSNWSSRSNGVCVKRLQLLGHKQMFEGLFRVTRDPCSCVYEVCLT